MVSHQASRPLERPVPEALSEVTWAFSVRRDSRKLPHAGGHGPLRGKGVAILAASAQQHERYRLGEIPEASASVSLAHPQDRPHHLIELAGQHSDAPEWYQNAGDRGTVCVHCARTGLWGGWLGNHRLYPEADRPQRPRCPVRVSVGGGGGSPPALGLRTREPRTRPPTCYGGQSMGLLTDDMKRVVEEQRLGFVATVCP